MLQSCDVPILCRPHGEAGPCYVLRRPMHFERVLFEQRIADLGGSNPGQVEMLDALDVAVRRQLAAEPERLAAARAEIGRQRDAVLQWRDAARAMRPRIEAARQQAAAAERRGEAGPAVPELPAMPEASVVLLDLQDDMAAQDQRYRRRAAAPSFWSFHRGCAAAELFLQRIDGPEPIGPFGPGGPDRATLSRIPSEAFHAMGRDLEAALEPDPDVLGNSGSGSGGEPDPQRSA